MVALKPVLVTAPAAFPVSLDMAKRNCRIDHGDEDELILMLIESAVSMIDGPFGLLGRAIINQSWSVSTSAFCDRLELPVDPFVSVTSVQYYDADNTLQTLANTVYAAFVGDDWPYIALKSGQAWPSVYARDDAIKVTWVAGYGANESLVPASIRHAILKLVADGYDHRGASVTGETVAKLPFAVDALLGPRRRVGV